MVITAEMMLLTTKANMINRFNTKGASQPLTITGATLDAPPSAARQMTEFSVAGELKSYVAKIVPDEFRNHLHRTVRSAPPLPFITC